MSTGKAQGPGIYRNTPSNRMTVCVEIDVFNDERVYDTIRSVISQTLKPDRILVVDGGSGESFLEGLKDTFAGNDISIEVLEGKLVESREKALSVKTEDITVYLDSDEVAPPGWLSKLIKPLVSDNFDFAGGPTTPYRKPETWIEKYYDELENKIYSSDIKGSVAYLPMGNSAWKTALLTRLRFDTRLRYSSEDYDIAIRALRTGSRGCFVSDAWVYHNKTSEKKFTRLIKKRYYYLVGTTVAIAKNHTLFKRVSEARTHVSHPFGIIETAMKPFAVVHGIFLWYAVIRRR